MGIIDSLKKKSTTTAKKAGAKKSAAAKTVEETVVEAPTTSTATNGVKVSRFSGVLTHPVVSEKAAHAEANNAYTFIVNRTATKHAVKQAVKDMYGIMPTKVRMINTQGKVGRFGGYGGRRQDVKKAVITLPKGQTIRIHEGV